MKTILIVDDEPHLRLLYEMELHRAGYRTMTAANARECLEFVETMHIDLIILDIRMPGMDGIEVLNRIVAQRKGVPIIIHSAYGGYRSNYLAWAADAYLIKSSNLEKLVGTVRKLLSPKSEAGRIPEPPARIQTHATERNYHVESAL